MLFIILILFKRDRYNTELSIVISLSDQIMFYLLSGNLSEKDQNYKISALNYEQAWLHSAKSDLAIGYKLAYAFLKLKKYPECIVVCRHILKVHPDYPKIKKEIFEKAKTNLRT